MDLIPSPSPSVKIQIMDRKGIKKKTLLGVVNKLFVFKSFAFAPEAHFPAHNLNFH